MSRSAQNALLKLFEEPPASASFVICCDRRDALLPTVLSRALLIPLGPLDDRTLRAYLADRHRDAPADRLDAAVRFAQGSIGRAESFLTPASQEASRAAADFCALLFAKGGAFAWKRRRLCRSQPSATGSTRFWLSSSCTCWTCCTRTPAGRRRCCWRRRRPRNTAPPARAAGYAARSTHSPNRARVWRPTPTDG